MEMLNTTIGQFSTIQKAVLKMLQSPDGQKRKRKIIAHELGIGEPTLSKIISEFRSMHFIQSQPIAVLNPKEIGFNCIGLAKILCTSSRTKDTLLKIIVDWSEIQEIFESFDNMCVLSLKIRVPTLSHLSICRTKLLGTDCVQEVKIDPVVAIKETTDLAFDLY